MTKIKIERGVPIPLVDKPERESKYPFGEMEIEESFFVPNTKPSSMHACISRFKKSKGSERKFTVRSVTEKQGDKDVEGVRIWRIE